MQILLGLFDLIELICANIGVNTVKDDQDMPSGCKPCHRAIGILKRQCSHGIS
jgi:hypothetical protein